jgi:hypothetical protein
MRIIDQLRKLYPGKWRYDSEFNCYVHESGRTVYRCAALAPRYDGDDDSFETQLRWSDTGERIYLYKAML